MPHLFMNRHMHGARVDAWCTCLPGATVQWVSPTTAGVACVFLLPFFSQGGLHNLPLHTLHRCTPPTAHPTPAQKSQQEGPACVLPPEEPAKLSPREAFSFLIQSPQIRALALMAIAQGVCTNVLDLAWKSHLRLLHPTPAAYSAFMGEVAMATGVVTGGLMLATPLMFRLMQWRGVAAATPIFMMAMGMFVVSVWRCSCVHTSMCVFVLSSL